MSESIWDDDGNASENSPWESANQWYKAGYSEAYNWYASTHGDPCMSDIPAPGNCRSREEFKEYLTGQFLGELDAEIIHWARLARENG